MGYWVVFCAHKTSSLPRELLVSFQLYPVPQVQVGLKQISFTCNSKNEKWRKQNNSGCFDLWITRKAVLNSCNVTEPELLLFLRRQKLLLIFARFETIRFALTCGLCTTKQISGLVKISLPLICFLFDCFLFEVL